MNTTSATPAVAIVTGASGQDGYLLTRRLLAEGWTVHATVRRPDALRALSSSSEGEPGRLHVHAIDLLNPSGLLDLVAALQPTEFYNLAGQSSVSVSFIDPLYTWHTNAGIVAGLLEHLRRHSPHPRFTRHPQQTCSATFPAARTCITKLRRSTRRALTPAPRPPRISCAGFTAGRTACVSRAGFSPITNRIAAPRTSSRAKS